jgi:hypothetical protein
MGGSSSCRVVESVRSACGHLPRVNGHAARVALSHHYLVVNLCTLLLAENGTAPTAPRLGLVELRVVVSDLNHVRKPLALPVDDLLSEQQVQGTIVLEPIFVHVLGDRLHVERDRRKRSALDLLNHHAWHDQVRALHPECTIRVHNLTRLGHECHRNDKTARAVAGIGVVLTERVAAA